MPIFYFTFFYHLYFQAFNKRMHDHCFGRKYTGGMFYSNVHIEVCPSVFSPLPQDEEPRPSLVHTAKCARLFPSTIQGRPCPPPWCVLAAICHCRSAHQQWVTLPLCLLSLSSDVASVFMVTHDSRLAENSTCIDSQPAWGMVRNYS